MVDSNPFCDEIDTFFWIFWFYLLEKYLLLAIIEKADFQKNVYKPIRKTVMTPTKSASRCQQT
jgi:hypothetical protein